MNISAPFILRPVMTTLLMAALVIFGAFGYATLPVSELPNVDFPTIVVSASLPGADPETMASAVATPLESQFSTIAGIDSMTSSSTQGSHPDHDPVQARPQHRRAPRRTCSRPSRPSLRKLPPNMPTPPTLRKVNPADPPIMFMAMRSDTLPMSEGRRICRNPAGAPAFHPRRRGAGQCLRRAEIRGAHPGRPGGAGRAADRHRPACQRGRRRQRQSRDRHAERTDADRPSSTPTAS